MERQLATSVSGIRKDHVERYRFAAGIADTIVLDAACGCGYGSSILHDSACSVIGIDIDPGAIKWAERHYSGPEYRLGDLMHIDIPEVDCIVSFETIEHFRHPEELLERFREAGDLLICSVPNENRYPFVAKNFANDEYPHYRHYTPYEFEKLLRSCGWNVLGKWMQKDKASQVLPGTDGMFLVYVCR